MRNSFLLLISILFFSCSSPEPRAPITVRKSTIYEETAKNLKKINEVEESNILNYIKKDSLISYNSSPDGFWYTIIKQGKDSTKKPKRENVVSLSYEIEDLEGKTIYSKEELGEKKYKVDKEDFIRALQFGIKDMTVGETRKFIIPSYNAFGVTGDENKIGYNKTLIITLTLNNINEN